ncbi:hypothetical protein MVEN_00808700 [Mycena venus]|uniref:DUF6535 domain-containing protein n=1 Tax=Mycena venus TaxID=2733690 RepID=A0A8H6YKK3_9AGAR|nr:hypothetical protein MVEN_00808700 [Mycena venus]
MADGGQTTPEPISDSDRLIAVLQTCFSELSQKQDERTERLHQAVDALRPQAPASDKKTAFWNSYMKLADEHDKEFQQKYSTDLDTALIFAGLFSAVSSAFIIQIQPFLTPPFSIIIVAVLSLLYISLFTTLLAALLAVLGKQWVMYYQAAGSRGTIEQRGLERQRKLDGLRKWKFDAVLQAFPLLLQLALLLFSSALSLYLWTVHCSIAAIVLGFTLLGVGCYVFLLASAVLSPDSPFQTPLAPPLLSLMSKTRHTLNPLLDRWKLIQSSLASFFKSKPSILPFFSLSPPLRSQQEVTPDYYFSQTSVEVPAVVWALETSTDPIVVSAAAEMAIGLQWPLDLDFKLLTDRLTEGFGTCVDYDGTLTLRKGMGKRAMNCGMAFGSLRHTAQASSRYHRWDFYWLWDTLDVDNEIASLGTVTKILRNDFSTLDISDPALIRWQLDIIPFLRRSEPMETTLGRILQGLEVANMPNHNEAIFATYLCCVNSLFSPVEPRILAEVDKSRLKYRLLAQLFTTLQNKTTSHTSLVMRVIDTTAKLASKSTSRDFVDDAEVKNLMTEISRFCVTFPLRSESLRLFVSAATLAEFGARQLQYAKFTLTQSVEWVFSALKYLQQSLEENSSESGDNKKWDSMTGSLLQFLAFTDASELPDQPPLDSFSIILQALSAPSSASLLAFLALSQAKKWLLDPNLQPLMDRDAVWSQLGRVALEYPQFKARYYELGQYLADTSEWKSAIYHDPLTWITTFTTPPFSRRGRKEFLSATRTVWLPALDDQEKFEGPAEIWSVVIKVLAKAWEIFDSSPTLRDCFSLARSTVDSSFGTWMYMYTPITHDIRSSVSPQLGASVLQVAANIRHANLIPGVGAQSQSTTTDELSNATPASERLADFLDVLGQKLSTEFAPTPGSEVQLNGLTRQYHNWGELRKHFVDELIAMEQLLDLREDEMGSRWIDQFGRDSRIPE